MWSSCPFFRWGSWGLKDVCSSVRGRCGGSGAWAIPLLVCPASPPVLTCVQSRLPPASAWPLKVVLFTKNQADAEPQPCGCSEDNFTLLRCEAPSRVQGPLLLHFPPHTWGIPWVRSIWQTTCHRSEGAQPNRAPNCASAFAPWSWENELSCSESPNLG